MLLVTGIFRLDPDRLAEIRPMVIEHILKSRVEQGCVEFSYAEDLVEPGLIRVTERWTGHVALAAHIESPHVRQMRAEWGRLGIRERSLSLYEIGDPRPM